MNILKEFRKLKLDFLIKQLSTEDKDKVTGEILTLLKPAYFRETEIVATSRWRFNLVFETLVDYNKALMKLCDLLDKDMQISPDWCKYQYKEITYDKFFTHSGKYVDKDRELNEFIRLTKMFRMHMTNIRDAHIGVKGHNYRQLTKFSTHLDDVILQIIRCSHEVSTPKLFQF